MAVAPFPLEDNLVAAREARGLSGVQLAAAADITPSMLSAYESGRVLPGVLVLVRLADALEVTTDFLAGRTANPESAGETTRSILELLGALTTDELQTLNDLVRSWTRRRTKRSAPALVVPDDGAPTPNQWLVDRIERLRKNGEPS